MKTPSPADPVIRSGGTSEEAWNGWPGLTRLPRVDAETLVPDGARVIVVAPHPDDEVLMVGGLLAQLARKGIPVRVIAVTDGTASHRGSSTWTPRLLRQVRPRESRAALRCLGIVESPLRLKLEDGALSNQRGRLAERLCGLIDFRDVVFTTWHRDGHPDHEATARACASAARRRGARLVEVPVWAWNWAEPGDPRLPWRSACRLPLDSDATRRKCFAMQAYESQILPDASTGAQPVLDAVMLQRAARPFEVLFPAGHPDRPVPGFRSR
ncbi:PIG-L family deacetylase [Variovorax ureilyticus]|uniref:PIG-L family deacetylase n=1 Tax=Variovorax ureilyticus TaxID=1836198 RepID=A0ABU8VHG5_9BURK